MSLSAKNQKILNANPGLIVIINSLHFGGKARKVGDITKWVKDNPNEFKKLLKTSV